ncbi:MAG: NHL repeat-containing protein, partial [Elusimicrobiales bacterium]|nr:NHL repeat-containing protein [Elusimicrobiales bacterium]
MGNIENHKLVAVSVGNLPDVTAPVTEIEIAGSALEIGATAYIAETDSITLTAVDPVVDDWASGIDKTLFLIDKSTDECEGVAEDLNAPQGTCENPTYSDSFILSAGAHIVSFFSIDNAGNSEDYKIISFFVGDLPDITAPITELDFTHESYQSPEGQLYTNVISSIELTAYDPQIENQTNSGFATTYYLVDVDTTTVQPLMYSEPFSLTEGSHTVYYASVDNAENFEEGKTTIVYADGTAPITSLRVSEFESSGVGETVYMVETDSISITVIDPVVNGVASDVNAIYFLVDTTIDQCLSEPTLNGPAGTCENPVYSEPFILSAGTHTIYYMSADNVDNKEEAKTVNIVVESSFSFDFSGTAQSPTSISWVWNLKEDATAYQVISSSGGAISSILDGSATYYIQTNLIPNTRYSNFLKAYSSIVSESAISETITFANVPMSVESFASGQSASVVIGQQDLYSNYWESGPSGLASPRGVALDKIGNLWVVDSSNYRVLRFSPPFTNGMSANLVLGQSSLYLSLDPPSRWPSSLEYPESLVFDAEGNLWVSDPGNNRIVRFSPPFTNGMDANLVLGAPSFYTYFPGAVTAKNFSGMYINLAIDSTENLWVSDSSNHRVLRFSPPFTNGMDANLVIGQADFNSSGTAYSPPVSDKLCVPGGISFDGEDNLWVTDVFNDRVLKFEKPFTNGEDATLVIGQPDFYTNYFGESYTGTTQDRLHVPVALNFDALNNLYVMDHRNKRIVGFKPPFSNGMNANLVIGQPDFTTNIGDTTPENFKGFFMGDIEMSGFVITDFQGRMWVSDVRNNRVLLFESGKAQAFSEIDSSSFTVRWDGNFNSEETLY